MMFLVSRCDPEEQTYHAAEGSSANYQHNLNHAFQTASNVAQYVNGLSGSATDKVVVAHSMGNIVISSAITDHQMAVSKYLMVDAAVATEAYDASTWNTATNSNFMMHADWRLYQPNTWCSTWHKLFTNAPGDSRQQLTWTNRFAPAVSVGYNYFSSGDEVFEIYTNSSAWFLSGVAFDAFWDSVGGFAWQKQELWKGRKSSILTSLGTTEYAGWGFSTAWGFRKYSAEEAALLTEAQLRDDPVFREELDEMLVSPISDADLNNALAQAIPALSHATGRNAIDMPGVANFDMNELYKNGWPRPEDYLYKKRWLHNDLREMAYLYIFEAFDAMADKGGLK